MNTESQQHFQAYWLQYTLTKRCDNNRVEIGTLLELMRKIISTNRTQPEFIEFLYGIPGYADHMTYLYDEHGDSSTYRQFLPNR